MKLKEKFYMIGIRPKIKKFGHEIIDLDLDKNTSIQWAWWKNPRARVLPRLKDYNTLKKFINPGDLVIDLGAHVGDTTLPQALAAGKDGLSIALEPNPATFNVLDANSALNKDKTNIIAINAAAMPNDGEFIFQYNDPSLVNGGYQKGISIFRHASFFKITVKGINLSDYLIDNYPDRLNRFTFLKTDLEGGDYQAFLTLKEIIKSQMPIIQSEINGVMTIETRNSYIDDLESMQYKVYRLKGATIDELEALTPSMVNSDSTFDIFAIPPHKTNRFNLPS